MWLGIWTPNPGVLISNAAIVSKVDSALHPSVVNNITQQTFTGLEDVFNTSSA